MKWKDRNSNFSHLNSSVFWTKSHLFRLKFQVPTNILFNLNWKVAFVFWSGKSVDTTMIMEATRSCSPSPFPSIASQQSLFSWRSGGLGVCQAKLSEPNARRANLSAKKKERILVPSYSKTGRGNMEFHISEFLNHPSGIEAVLNTRALQSFEFLDGNLYRCVLPQIQFLNFEVAPVLDLQVISTKENCTVDMLSCKFKGSELVENQNDRFAASMRNHITWATIDSESFLDVDVKLNITLEIYTYPFTFLPESAVEGPGNLMMQALVDRLVPLHVQQLLSDYDKWVLKQLEALQ